MHADFLRSSGLVKSIKFEKQKTVTGNHYTIKCLPNNLQEVNVRRLTLHFDNGFSHSIRLTVEFLKNNNNKIK